MLVKDILNQYEPKPLGEQRQYAVLLPLVYDEKTEHCQVLYQIRSEHISQPGEVAFPGGRVEEGESFEKAAVRETCEELNLQHDQIELWGEIDYFVHGGRTIRCFVGRLNIDDWRRVSPNEEVERLFTVDLDTLLTVEPTYYTLKSQLNDQSDFPFELIRNGYNYDFGQSERQIPFYRNLPENIWGMTALFTHRFTEIVNYQNELNRQLQVDN